MPAENGPNEQPEDARREVYLVVREGPAWRDIYRLVPGAVVTVGRDPSNHVILRDDRCSRRHCSLFDDGSAWMVRDLGSRNGTLVNGTLIDQPCPLEEGAVITIGASELVFTGDISRPLDRPSRDDPLATRETGALDVRDDSRGEPLILERKSQTRLFTESSLAEERNREPGMREALATLYRLIVGMVSAANRKDLCRTALEGLVPAVGADIGAVLLFPEQTADATDPSRLEIVSYLSPKQVPYRRVSTKLSRLVLQEKEAVLAMGISGQGESPQFRTLHAMEAKSVICAPIRRGGEIRGLLHLYSLRPDRQLDADSLELVLAVGDHLATVLKGLEERESLAASLQRASDQNRSLQQLLEIESDLVGDSLPMRQLRDTIARVAASDATVLVRGESGVGKELVARAIHFNSPRRHGPLVCLNCAALTETLLESALFGYEKGAFTGATERRIGKFEQAHGGTLFLDEVGEMPLSIQAKFLRVLEGHPFERVGGSQSIHADVRLVAASNRNLEAAVEEGEFRKDLLYRLQVIEIRVPLLREHAADIPALAEHLLDRACRRFGRVGMRLAPSAIEALCQYDWPGNVRELRNVIERAVVLAAGPEIVPSDLRFTALPGSTGQPLNDFSGGVEPIALEEVERLHILRTLRWTGGKKREAARILGINRSTLDRKLEKYGIAPPSAPGSAAGRSV